MIQANTETFNLHSVGLDGSGSADGLPKPGVDGAARAGLDPLQLARGFHVQFLHCPVGEREREDDRDHEGVGGADHYQGAQDAQPCPQQSAESRRNPLVDLVKSRNFYKTQ